MLDYPTSVVQTKDVDPGPILVAGPFLAAVQHDVVALRNGALEVHPLTWILPGHALEVLNERLLAIGDMRVVLTSPACLWMASLGLHWLNIKS